MAEKTHYYIRVGCTLVEVSREIYTAYHQLKRRERYLEERDRNNGVFSYHALDTGELMGEELFSDPQAPTAEKAAIAAILQQQLRRCLAMLPKPEQELLHALYFEELTERQYAQRRGISQASVRKQRIKLIQKLRRMMKIEMQS